MSSLPWRRIAGWGFLLNAAWEFAQCVFLYDMWDWGFWRATLWMWGAIAGDVVIVVGVVFTSALLFDGWRRTPPHIPGWLGLLLVGLVAGVGLEWLAQVLGLWGYTSLMPTVTVAGHAVGLSPVLQVALLPVLSLYLAARWRARK